MTSPNQNANFETTHWSRVVSSREQDSDIRRHSLGELCESYWYPLFAFLRRKGNSPDAAADYVQGFFVELVDKNFLDAVSPEKGRFRWFLMSAINRFVSKQVEKQSAQKRGGDRQFFSLNIETAEQRYQLEPTEGWTPEKLFDRRWALTVLEQALAELKQRQTDKGKLELYEALRPTLSGVPMANAEYAEIAQRFQMYEGAVKVAALRLRQKYRDIIREIVGQTVAESNRVSDEIDELFKALSG
jgi:RNA polymerase sigma-70 factor (ECF subfamily)